MSPMRLGTRARVTATAVAVAVAACLLGVAFSLWADATEQIQKYGAMIKSPTGYPVQSP